MFTRKLPPQTLHEATEVITHNTPRRCVHHIFEPAVPIVLHSQTPRAHESTSRVPTSTVGPALLTLIACPPAHQPLAHWCLERVSYAPHGPASNPGNCAASTTCGTPAVRTPPAPACSEPRCIRDASSRVSVSVRYIHAAHSAAPPPPRIPEPLPAGADDHPPPRSILDIQSRPTRLQRLQRIPACHVPRESMYVHLRARRHARRTTTTGAPETRDERRRRSPAA
ncbi:hypothetical protein DFH09DRAFT_1309821 [Mycena vulgaris]|nr:hypothetical protein DFH09DRAFT_1309821 [Mycena vulgaris]